MQHCVLLWAMKALSDMRHLHPCYILLLKIKLSSFVTRNEIENSALSCQKLLLFNFWISFSAWYQQESVYYVSNVVTIQTWTTVLLLHVHLSHSDKLHGFLAYYFNTVALQNSKYDPQNKISTKSPSLFWWNELFVRFVNLMVLIIDLVKMYISDGDKNRSI